MSIVNFSELLGQSAQKVSCVQLVHVLVLVMNTGTVLFGSLPHRIHALASWVCTKNVAAQEAST
jgi:hypothetical protein